MPESVEFNDSEYSWQVFILLESFRDGTGTWNIQQVLGKPVMEIEEELIQDLLKWRWLKGIVEDLNKAEDWMNSDPNSGDR